MNHNIILIGGKSTSGKSTSLMNLRDQEGVLYLGCENNKELPFKHKFETYNITNPLQVFEAFDYSESPEGQHIHTIVVDTITFLMDMFESQMVLPAQDTRAAWGDYAQYWKELTQNYFANSTKRIAILGHTADVINDDKIKETVIKVKGSLMNTGLEAAFNNVISTKRIPLKDLKDYQSDLLNVTEDDEIQGYKHVFQTRITKDTTGERIRGPIGMWARNETFIDNDLQAVFDRLEEYYK